MLTKVAVINSHSFGRLYPEHLSRLSTFADVTRVVIATNFEPDAIAAQLRGVQAVIASVNPQFNRAVLSKLDDLVLLVRHGVGTDNVDVPAATELGIMVANVPSAVEEEAVAEHALALILSLARRLPFAARALREGRWDRRAEFIGLELRGKVVGLIGCGHVGQRLSEILSRGLQARVLACDPAVSAETLAHYGATKVDLDELLSLSSIISLHCNLSPGSFRMLGQREFSLMRSGALLVNTARGELVDMAALTHALQSNHLNGYATDVVEVEPVHADHPLLALPNVLVVPHLGGYTAESLWGMGEAVVDAIENVFNRLVPPLTLINSGVLLTSGFRGRAEMRKG